jgi:hypothetical protein
LSGTLAEVSGIVNPLVHRITGAIAHAARIVLSRLPEQDLTGGGPVYSTSIVTKSMASVFVVSVDQIETPKPAALTISGVSVALHRSATPPFVEITFVAPETVTFDFATPISVGVVSLWSCGT